MSNTAYCKGCKKLIVFVRTRAGKSMPCESRQVEYITDPQGEDTILTHDGDIVKGWIFQERTERSELGYLPHFINCPAARHFKKAKTTKSRKPAPTGQPEQVQFSIF